MKSYDVTITETLQKTVSIRADSHAKAEEIAEEKWKKEKYVLTADDFVEARFDAIERVRNKEYER